jgi:hypothetical protein
VGKSSSTQRQPAGAIENVAARWPATESARRGLRYKLHFPVRTLMVPTTAVTNCEAGFSQEISSFTKRRSSANACVRRADSCRAFTQGHEQRRGTPLPETSPTRKEKAIFVEHESIVQIAPDFERRLQHRMEFQVGGQSLDGAGSGQHAHLDLRTA